MKYQDKLNLMFGGGAVLTLVGTYLLRDFSSMGVGYGLMTLGIFGDNINTSQDEFADLREEFHKRERLYGKLWKK